MIWRERGSRRRLSSTSADSLPLADRELPTEYPASFSSCPAPSRLGRRVLVVCQCSSPRPLALKDGRIFESTHILSVLLLALLIIVFSHSYWVALP